jgi:hypothetical protein
VEEKISDNRGLRCEAKEGGVFQEAKKRTTGVSIDRIL